MYFLFKMGTFHCHVSLPEGRLFIPVNQGGGGITQVIGQQNQVEMHLGKTVFFSFFFFWWKGGGDFLSKHVLAFFEPTCSFWVFFRRTWRIECEF